MTVLLVIGVLPQSGSPAGSARKQRDKIECEACNWVVEQLDEVWSALSFRNLAPLAVASCLAQPAVACCWQQLALSSQQQQQQQQQQQSYWCFK